MSDDLNAERMAMTQISASDLQYEEVLIRKVDASPNGYALEREDGFSMWIDKGDFEPQPGQVARFYGRGIGHIVRGVVVGGHVAFYRTPEEEAARREVESIAYEAKRRIQMAETKIPDVVTPGFEWTEDTRQISGFGGGYERACRQMVSQGCRWWAERPEAKPAFRGFKAIYGVCMEDNDDAKLLSAAICEGVDPSGAMHQASVGHVMRWRHLGSWEAYQAEMREMAAAETDG